MISTQIHPEVRDSFRANGHGGFISRNGGFPISCPPYTIASLAATDPGLLTLPEGYGEDTLERIKDITGWTDRDVYISGRQASELAQIGRQILALSAAGKTNLGYFADQSIEHLVRTVES